MTESKVAILLLLIYDSSLFELARLQVIWEFQERHSEIGIELIF